MFASKITMTNAWRASLVAVLGALIGLSLGACSNSTQVGDPLFPLGEGRSWTYKNITKYDGPVDSVRETQTIKARGQEEIGGKPAWRRRSDTGVDYWLRFDDTGVYRIATKTDVDRDPKIDPDPRFVLRKPYTVGTEWVNLTSPYILERPNEFSRKLSTVYKPFPMTYRIDALNETVETSAGTFKGCLRVAGRAVIKSYVDSSGVWDDVPLTTTEWYCPDVGLVRLIRREKSTTKLVRGGEFIMDLAAWTK